MAPDQASLNLQAQEASHTERGTSAQCWRNHFKGVADIVSVEIAVESGNICVAGEGVRAHRLKSPAARTTPLKGVERGGP